MIRPGRHTPDIDRRLEPRFFVSKPAETRTLPAPTGLRTRLNDYAEPSRQSVRPVLKPMRPRQILADPNTVGPFCLSLGAHCALLVALLWPHNPLPGSENGTQQPINVEYIPPPSKAKENPVPPAVSPESQGHEHEHQPSTVPRPASGSEDTTPSPALPTPEIPSSPLTPRGSSAELSRTPDSHRRVTPGHAPNGQSRKPPHTPGHNAHGVTTKGAGNPFAHPMDLSFREQPTTQPYRQRHTKSHGSFDTSLGPLSMNGQINAPYRTHSSIKGAGEDYGKALTSWISAHSYYPPEAGRRGEEGSCTVHVVIDRSGHVRSVRLLESSNSYALDAALVSIFQSASLPPPPDMKNDHFDINITMNYSIIRP